jgi:signal transduction histidine kinase
MLVFKENFEQKVQHEIRTPLTVILGMIDFLKNSELTLDQDHYVNSIHDAAKRLLGVTTLLDKQNQEGH